MMSAIASDRFGVDRESRTIGEVFSLDALDGPGTYVCNRSGYLLRVPAGEACAGCFGDVRRSGAAQRTATKISADPRLPRSKARALAGIFGLHPSF